jgi:hypothetical protein
MGKSTRKLKRSQQSNARGSLKGLIVYGATCTFWGQITDAAQLPSGLPCCPHCHGILFQMDFKDWFDQAMKYAKDNKDPEYLEFLFFMMKRQCKPYAINAGGSSNAWQQLRAEYDNLLEVANEALDVLESKATVKNLNNFQIAQAMRNRRW